MCGVLLQVACFLLQISVTQLTGPKATGEVREITLSIEGKMPYWVRYSHALVKITVFSIASGYEGRKGGTGVMHNPLNSSHLLL